MKKKSLMRKIGIVLFLLFLFAAMLSGCVKKRPDIDLAGIKASDVSKIKHSGTTGAKDGDYSYFLSDSEKNGFIELLNQVEIGDSVDKTKALTSGASSYYTLIFTDGGELTISPWRYFMIGDTYYEFRNFDELWDRFVTFNSLR